MMNESSGAGEPIRFGPGDEILVKELGSAAKHAREARAAGVTARRLDGWHTCVPVDQRRRDPASSTRRKDARTSWLSRADLLFVPHYLLERTTQEAPEYHHLRYSRAIRFVGDASGSDSPLVFDGKSSVTAVLPDHFYTGGWTCFEDRFAPDTHFVLASDGFYGCFSNAGELSRWLRENETKLSCAEKQAELLESLHAELRRRCGDDDISFVWVRPMDLDAPITRSRDATVEREEDSDAR